MMKRMQAAISKCKHVALNLRMPAAKLAPNARIARLQVRGAGKSSQLEIGESSIVSAMIRFDREDASVRVGSRSFLGNALLVSAKSITIGDDVLISWGVTIVDHNSHAVCFGKRKHDVAEWLESRKSWENVKIAPVTICSKSWIGFGASILPGVTVGEGAVVGARSVVTKDVAPWTIVGGNPAKQIGIAPQD